MRGMWAKRSYTRRRALPLREGRQSLARSGSDFRGGGPPLWGLPSVAPLPEFAVAFGSANSALPQGEGYRRVRGHGSLFRETEAPPGEMARSLQRFVGCLFAAGRV